MVKGGIDQEKAKKGRLYYLEMVVKAGADVNQDVNFRRDGMAGSSAKVRYANRICMVRRPGTRLMKGLK